MRVIADVYHMIYSYETLKLNSVYKGAIDVTDVKPHCIEKECRKHWLLDWEKAIKIIVTQIDDEGTTTLSDKIYKARP